MNHLDMGRGGFGSDNFSFALLDWTNSESGRRRRHYIANGGVVGATRPVTIEMWHQLFGFNAPIPNE